MDDQSLQNSVKLSGKTRSCAFRVSELQITAPSAQEALVEGLRYRPRTQATRVTFELILTIVAKNLGDVYKEIVRSAADAILENLKDEDLKDFDKKEEIDDFLGGSLSPKEFNELIDLGKKITDYDAEDEDEEMDGADDDQEIDERQGVAVAFEEEDEDGEGIVNEIHEESSEDEDEEDDDRPGLDEEAGAGGAAEDRDGDEATLP